MSSRYSHQSRRGAVQYVAVQVGLDGVGLPLGEALGQASVLYLAIIALVPVRGRRRVQPPRRDRGDGVQRGPQGLGHQLQSVQGADCRAGTQPW